MPSPILTLRLCGPVRLTGPGGADLTPRQGKALGLLALMGSAPGLRRPRAFLQDKLWSESDAERGAASLRQCLTELRAALGAHRDAIVSEGSWVGLDETAVRVAIEPTPSDWGFAGEPPEFAAGLDVRDPEFDDWLRDQRMAFEARLEAGPPARPAAPARAAVPALAFAASGGDGALAALAELAAVEAAAMAAALGGVVARPAEGSAVGGAVLALEVTAAGQGTGALLQARWRDPATGAVLATLRRAMPAARTTAEPGGALDGFVAEAAFMGALEIGAADGPAQDEAAALVFSALRDLGAFDRARIERSDGMLARAAAMRWSAAASAWRAHLRLAAVIERTAPDAETAAAEAIAFAAEALEAAPNDALALATAAEVALNLEGRPAKALSLAESAVARSPGHPLARGALSVALSASGEARRAYAEAGRALRLAQGWPNIAMWRMSLSIAALRCGRFAEAEKHAQASHELAPTYKPALRFLAALRFHRGDEPGAAAALSALRGLEPDFSLALMASEAYPVASLRGTPLLAVTRSGLL